MHTHLSMMITDRVFFSHDMVSIVHPLDRFWDKAPRRTHFQELSVSNTHAPISWGNALFSSLYSNVLLEPVEWSGQGAEARPVGGGEGEDGQGGEAQVAEGQGGGEEGGELKATRSFGRKSAAPTAPFSAMFGLVPVGQARQPRPSPAPASVRLALQVGIAPVEPIRTAPASHD
jgi:hypothetical protein